MLPGSAKLTVQLDDETPVTDMTPQKRVAARAGGGSASPPLSARRDCAGAFASSFAGVCITADAGVPG